MAAERKEDPDGKFDWKGLAASGVGLWPGAAPDPATLAPVCDPASLAELRRTLAEIGYNSAIIGLPRVRLIRRSRPCFGRSSATGDPKQ